MNRLPLVAFFVVGGAVLAQNVSTASRSFPYVGYLEENGVAVSGTRDVGVDLFTADSGGSACDSDVFEGVVVSEGRFQLTYEDVPEGCLKNGELYLTLSVGLVGGTRTALTSASGSRARVHSVPFAMAKDKFSSFLAGTNGGVLFERVGGQSRIAGDSSAIAVQPVTDIADTDPLFLVRSAGGAERLRVDDNNRVLVNERLDVAGSVAASGAVTATGQLQVNRVANVAKLSFPAGSGNDPASIEHLESVDKGELWINSSDNWGNTAGANTFEDRIVFGDRGQNVVRHQFDATGDAVHSGDLTVGGAISSGCPSGTTFVAGWCIDNVRNDFRDYLGALQTCQAKGSGICPAAAYMACEVIRPSGSGCSSDTNNIDAILHTGERHYNQFNEGPLQNLIGFRGNNGAPLEINTGSQLIYYCCSHAYRGLP